MVRCLLNSIDSHAFSYLWIPNDNNYNLSCRGGARQIFYMRTFLSIIWDLIYCILAMIPIFLLMWVFLHFFNIICTIDILNFETFLRVTHKDAIDHPHFWYDYALIVFLFLADLSITAFFAFSMMGIPSYCLRYAKTEIIPFITKEFAILMFLCAIYDSWSSWLINLTDNNIYIKGFLDGFYFSDSVPTISPYIFGLFAFIALIMPIKASTAGMIGRIVGKYF